MTTPGDRPVEHIRAINIRLAEDAVPAVENESLPPEKSVGPAGLSGVRGG